MAERVALSLLYRETFCRCVLLAGGMSDSSVAVPATPGWSAHDVLAHLAGVAEDMAGGNGPPGGPTPEWTSAQVMRRRGIPTTGVLRDWERQVPAVEALLDRTPLWPLVFDATAHEFDLRGAIGDQHARDATGVVLGAKLLLGGLTVPAPLRVITEHHDLRVGPDTAEPTVLRTTTFEAFRWRLGRRSRDQLIAMDWSADPSVFLPHLCVFGPADRDLIE